MDSISLSLSLSHTRTHTHTHSLSLALSLSVSLSLSLSPSLSRSLLRAQVDAACGGSGAQKRVIQSAFCPRSLTPAPCAHLATPTQVSLFSFPSHRRHSLCSISHTCCALSSCKSNSGFFCFPPPDVSIYHMSHGRRSVCPTPRTCSALSSCSTSSGFSCLYLPRFFGG